MQVFQLKATEPLWDSATDLSIKKRIQQRKQSTGLGIWSPASLVSDDLPQDEVASPVEFDA